MGFPEFQEGREVVLAVLCILLGASIAAFFFHLKYKSLERQVFYDPLTGIPNYLRCVDRLQQAIAYAARSQTRVAIFFMDLDGFKKVNDDLGHLVGDKLLMQVAHLIATCFSRATDVVARRSGDEFISLATVRNAADCAALARETTRLLSQPYRNLVAGGEVAGISVSIGIAIYPDHGHDVQVLLNEADKAMYRAKRDRGSTERFCFAGQSEAAKDASANTFVSVKRA